MAYSDIDRLILDRWDEVNLLLEAREEVEDRMGEVIKAAGERLRRWLDPLGYNVEVWPRDAEFHTYRRTWEVKKRGPAVSFSLDAFCPRGYRRNDEPYPSLYLRTEWLDNYKVKEPERRAFAADLRNQLGNLAAEWNDDVCDDQKYPLVHYLTQYDNRSRCELVSSSDNLYTFAVSELPRALAISDVVDQCVQKLLSR